jgi:long-chain fatty acid transport protein
MISRRFMIVLPALLSGGHAEQLEGQARNFCARSLKWRTNSAVIAGSGPKRLLNMTKGVCRTSCATVGSSKRATRIALPVRTSCRADDIGRAGTRGSVIAAAAFLAIETSTVAHATGFFINQQSTSGLGRADAGDAAAALDASTVFYNPAGMTELWRDADPSRDTLVQSGLHIIVPHSHLTNSGSTTTTPGTGGLALAYPGGDASNPGRISPVPNAYVVHRLFDGAAYVGLGITTPFGLSGQYQSDWFGRYDNLKSTLLTVNIGPVIAIPINPYLSIGGGIDIQYQSSTLSLAIPNPLAPGGPSLATDGHFDVRGDAWAVGYNIGILIKPTPKLRIGAHYRSAIDHTLSGTATTSGFNGPLSVLNASVGARAVSKLPDIITTGVVYQLTPDLGLFGEFSWYGWGRLGSARIQFDNGAPDVVRTGQFRDTFALAIGAEYRWSDQLMLRTGFKFDRTPTEDAFRDTSFADANRYWLAAGATYKLSRAASVDFAVVHVLEDATQVNVTRTVFDGSALASSTNVRAHVQSNVTTVSSGFSYRF